MKSIKCSSLQKKTLSRIISTETPSTLKKRSSHSLMLWTNHSRKPSSQGLKSTTSFDRARAKYQLRCQFKEDIKRLSSTRTRATLRIKFRMTCQFLNTEFRAGKVNCRQDLVTRSRGLPISHLWSSPRSKCDKTRLI